MKDFEVKVISEGWFVDTAVGPGASFLVEVYVIRLNHVALNDYILSGTMNCRDCYDTDEEWEEHKVEYEARRNEFNKRVVDALYLNPDRVGGSVKITQSQSEIFTVVHTRKLDDVS